MALPVTLALLAAVVVLAALLVTATPGSRLTRPVLRARRHSLTGATAAVVTGLACAAAVPASAALAGAAPGIQLLAVPVAFALGHTAALVVAEATWPRQRSTVRAAVLSRRTTADVFPRWLRRTFWSSAALVVVTCVVGWVTADPSGRALTALDGGGPGVDGGWSGTAGPYPGATYALPALVGTLAVLVAVEAGLRLVTDRPAVPDSDGAAERALRRASGHRLLRGATTGLLVPAGGLLFVMGTAAHSLYSGSLGGVVGQEQLYGHDPLLQHLGTAVAVLGALSVVAAGVVLLLPAPRVPAPATLPEGVAATPSARTTSA